MEIWLSLMSTLEEVQKTLRLVEEKGHEGTLQMHVEPPWIDIPHQVHFQ
jgi:hypothetical protein